MSKLDKEAETIQRLIDEGKLLESELPLLVREGLSQETVDHWKKYRLQKEDKMTSDVSQLIDKLTNAVSFKFKDDATSPNLTISKLRTGYYCSVVRYSKQGAAQKKVVVCKAMQSRVWSPLSLKWLCLRQILSKSWISLLTDKGGTWIARLY